MNGELFLRRYFAANGALFLRRYFAANSRLIRREVAAQFFFTWEVLQLTRRGSAPPGDSATRITGIVLGPIFFAPRRGIVCLWTDISDTWHPDATLIKQNARGTAGHNRVNCNRIPRAAVVDIPPAPPGDSAGQKIALIATGLYWCYSNNKSMNNKLYAMLMGYYGSVVPAKGWSLDVYSVISPNSDLHIS